MFAFEPGTWRSWRTLNAGGRSSRTAPVDHFSASFAILAAWSRADLPAVPITSAAEATRPSGSGGGMNSIGNDSGGYQRPSDVIHHPGAPEPSLTEPDPSPPQRSRR